MRRTLTGIILAATLAATQVAAPPAKAADAEDVLGLLLGIGAIYAIGKAIEQNRAEASAPVTRRVVPERIEKHGLRKSIRPEPRRDDHTWRKENERANWYDARRNLPAECLYRFDTRDGPLVGFGRQCLENTMRGVGRLPGDCAVRARVGGRDRTIYSARCLRLEGWQVAEARPQTWRPGGRIDN